MANDVFAQLVDAHYTALYRFAVSLTKNSADAGDLTQQTFLIWARRGHALRESSKAKSWLFTTLYREFLRHCRREQRIEPLEELSPGEADFAAPDPEAAMGERSGVALEALYRLDETYRVPLTLFYLKDFSYKEIAEILDVPIGTVMSRLARGKAQLAAQLKRPQSGAGGPITAPAKAS